MTTTTPATVLQSIANALDTTATLIHDATVQLRELAELINSEDLDEALTGNGENEDGIDLWPYGDAVRWTGETT